MQASILLSDQSTMIRFLFTIILNWFIARGAASAKDDRWWSAAFFVGTTIIAIDFVTFTRTADCIAGGW
jgi:hypothetical protein